MLVETQKHLDDLRKAGFDVSSLERQIKSSPVLEKQADTIIGKGILRQDVFTRNSQARADQVKNLEAQVAQLQGLVNAGAGESDQAYQVALEVIQEQQDLMLKAGFSEDEVAKLSEKAIQKASDKITPPAKTEPPVTNPPEKKDEGASMSDIDTSKFVDIDTFQKQTIDTIFGNAGLSAIINQRLLKASKLGIEIPDDKLMNLSTNLRTAVEQGKKVEEFLDEDFGIKAKQIELDTANQQKAIDDARKAGYADALKENNVPRRAVSRTGKHPLDGITQNNHREAPPAEPENKEIPRNKWGDAEVFRTRGNANSRIAAATAYHEKVLERTELENSIPSE